MTAARLPPTWLAAWVREVFFLPRYVGLLGFYLGGIVALPEPGLIVVLAALAVWMGVQIVRTQVWSGRARRWLALDA